MSYNVQGVHEAQGVHATSGASPAMPIYARMGDVYSQIDTSGTGSINRSQFNDAFSTMNPPTKFKAAGADAIWSQLKGSNTGTVSKQDFIQGIAKMSVAMASAQSPAQTAGISSSALKSLGLDLSA